MSELKDPQHEIATEQHLGTCDALSSSELSDAPSSPSEASNSPAPPAPPSPNPPRIEAFSNWKEDGENSSHKPPPLPKMPNRDAILAKQDRKCIQRSSHQLGIFCGGCRGIKMPWGEQLPYYTTAAGNRVDWGPKGAILANINLRDGFAIAVLSVVASLRANNQPEGSIKGLEHLIKKYPASAVAADRMVDLLVAIRFMVEEGQEAPEIHNIVHSILENPLMTATDFHDHAITMLGPGGRIFGRPATYVNETTQATIEWGGGSITPASHIASKFGAGPSSESPGTAAGINNEESDSSNEGQDNDDEELTFVHKKTPEGEEAKAPPSKGSKWALYKNQDIAPAVLGQVDGSKFFMLRQDTKDSSKFDCRQYPKWKTFDWFDPMDISALNRAREQWRRRTDGLIAKPRPFWTLAEKDVLKTLIERELAVPGVTDIDWTKVSKDLNNHFENRTQKAGELLAQSSKLNTAGEVVAYRKKVEKLKEDRVGSADRTKTCVKTQGKKYADIKKLLDTLPVKAVSKRTRDGKKKKENKPAVSDDGSENDSGDESENDEGGDPEEPTPKRPRRDEPRNSRLGSNKRLLGPDAGGPDMGAAWSASSDIKAAKTILTFR
ncbi:hypothetical protein EG329_009657 [Mollisiaceae sp. DMI_Dod_QoI]|nr:hypothetical protein EG329_009657 [Helotiales sp. DMI_Dod_QoI]